MQVLNLEKGFCFPTAPVLATLPFLDTTIGAAIELSRLTAFRLSKITITGST